MRLTSMVSQNLAQSPVAPGGLRATKKQTIRKRLLTASHRRLKGVDAVIFDIACNRQIVERIRRPLLWQQQIMQRCVIRIDGQGFGEILEIPIQIYILVGRATHMRKPIGIESVDIQHSTT